MMNEVTEKALKWATDTANNDTHGYSQASRWGPDYDCSSFIISAYENAGLKVKEAGASYTGNMKTALLRCGFTALPDLPVSSLVPGDVLLNEQHHAVMYVGNGKVVAARSSDGFPQRGDQSGREICVQDWYEYPQGGWDCVLRYGAQTPEPPAAEPEYCTARLPVLRKGDKGRSVKIMQLLLILNGYSCGPDGADGDFGPNTAKALKSFQTARGLCADTVCGKETWEELIKI